MKRKYIAFLLVLVLGVFWLTSCAQTEDYAQNTDNTDQMQSTAANVSTQTSATAAAAAHNGYKEEDLDDGWREADATAVISLNGMNVSIEGSGAKAEGATVTITAGGLYVVSGTLSDGQIIVKAPSTDTVRIVLNGVDITSNTSAAIYASQCDKLIITLAEDTENIVTDAKNYIYADAAAKEPNAAIFAKDDLTINGSGTLTVHANFNNGIGTKDDLVLVNGTYAITAVNDAIRGRDSVTILDGTYEVAAGGDGFQSNNDEDAAKGWIDILGGTFTLVAGRDGVQAQTALYIENGTFIITTGGGYDAANINDAESYKGLKAGGDIAMLGGTFHMDCADDGIHSNANIRISGGTYIIASGDDGVHADADLVFSDGDLTVTNSYEGMEASTMTISGGTITIAATDDGINCAGGNDEGMGGQFGPDRFSTVSDHWLLISGGTITIVAGSDGIDVNGSGEMTGGDVDITAATLGEGETIDTDGTWAKTGGTLTETGGNSPGGGMGGGMGGGQGGRRPEQK